MVLQLTRLIFGSIMFMSLISCTQQINSAKSSDLSSAGDKRAYAVAANNYCASANETATATLKCPSGQVVKSIVFASYGTPTGSCGAFKTSSCNASTSKSVVEAACLGKASCAVGAANSVFGDPCAGIGKKLRIQAVCGAPETTSTAGVCGDTEEGTTAQISCPAGQTISGVTFASYGIKSAGSCGSYVASTACHAANSAATLQAACVGKKDCYFDVTNDAFGKDPCAGTGKWFTYQVRCSGGTTTQPSPSPSPTVSQIGRAHV